MDYPKVGYSRRGPRELGLSSWDGAAYAVHFRTEAAAAHALKAGRADVDCSAVARGFLPHGSVLVRRIPHGSCPSSPHRGIDGLEEHITEDGDRRARLRQPLEAARHASIALGLTCD